MVLVKILLKIATNQIFVSSALAWVLAQSIKIMIYYYQYHRLNFRLLVGTGGMPSAHSALVSCLTTMVGMKEGFGSPLFMVSLCFSLIIMSDAAGVRRAAGHQAVVLNRLADDIYAGQGIRPERLKELLGHSPLQVFTGAFIGIVTALIFKFLPRMM